MRRRLVASAGRKVERSSHLAETFSEENGADDEDSGDPDDGGLDSEGDVESGLGSARIATSQQRSKPEACWQSRTHPQFIW